MLDGPARGTESARRFLHHEEEVKRTRVRLLGGGGRAAGSAAEVGRLARDRLDVDSLGLELRVLAPRLFRRRVRVGKRGLRGKRVSANESSVKNRVLAEDMVARLGECCTVTSKRVERVPNDEKTTPGIVRRSFDPPPAISFAQHSPSGVPKSSAFLARRQRRPAPRVQAQIVPAAPSQSVEPTPNRPNERASAESPLPNPTPEEKLDVGKSRLTMRTGAGSVYSMRCMSGR